MSVLVALVFHKHILFAILCFQKTVSLWPMKVFILCKNLYTVFLLVRAPSLIVAPPSRKTFNPFPNKPWFLRVCSTSLLKTLREKEKLLVTSNFSFSHSVFYPFRELSAIFIKIKIVVCKLFQFGRVYNVSFGKGLNHNNIMKIC